MGHLDTMPFTHFADHVMQTVHVCSSPALHACMHNGHSLLIFSANSMHARQNRWPHGVVAVALPASSLKQIGHSGGMSLGCFLRMCVLRWRVRDRAA